MADFTIDDKTLYTSRFSKICSFCIHLDKKSLLQGTPKCKAFFAQIPLEIWSGKNDHTKPYPGDRGILFTKIEF